MKKWTLFFMAIVAALVCVAATALPSCDRVLDATHRPKESCVYTDSSGCNAYINCTSSVLSEKVIGKKASSGPDKLVLPATQNRPNCDEKGVTDQYYTPTRSCIYTSDSVCAQHENCRSSNLSELMTGKSK